MIDFGTAFGETSMVTLQEAVRVELAAAMAPRDPLSITDCAERHRWLPGKTTSESGWYRVSRTPYMRKIMDAIGDPEIGRVVLMKGSQTGGTTAAENWILWTMIESPASMLSIWPTEKLLRRFSRERLEPMIDSTKRLKEIFDRSGLRHASDALAHKEFPGGSLNLITGRSADDLRSISVPRVHVSEVDRLLATLTMDGDPLELARSRGETFWDFKELLESTPLIHGESRIANEYEITNQHEWYMPCPLCNGPQVLRWRDGMEKGDYDKAGALRFDWEVDSAGSVLPGSVTYRCEHCEKPFAEHWKEQMLTAGEWIARFPDRVHWGFHLPAFPSPLISWDRICERFERAKKSTVKMQVFVNNICGLPYRERTRNITAHFLAQRAESYRADVPAGVRLIVVGADVQTDHVVLLFVGIGAGEETWILRHVLVEGEPGKAATWRAVAEELARPMVDTQGRRRHVKVGCIDSRHQGEHVKRFCRSWVGHRGARMIPIIGKEGRGRPIIEGLTALATRRTLSKKATRMVGIDSAKDLLASRLLNTAPGPEYVHFPDRGLDPAFFEQLTGEVLKTKFDKRRVLRVWEKKTPETVVDAWDCFVYSYAALASLGGRVLRDLAKLATAEPAQVVAISSSTPKPPAPPEDGPADPEGGAPTPRRPVPPPPPAPSPAPVKPPAPIVTTVRPKKRGRRVLSTGVL